MNYVTGLFNQSAILYDNDGIDVTLSELFVWDVPSPYTGPDQCGLLDQFGVTAHEFQRGYGPFARITVADGGVAYLNTLCSSSTAIAHGLQRHQQPPIQQRAHLQLERGGGDPRTRP
jgi:hypothetical protein